MALVHYVYFPHVAALAYREKIGGSVYDCIPPQERVLYLGTWNLWVTEFSWSWCSRGFLFWGLTTLLFGTWFPLFQDETVVSSSNHEMSKTNSCLTTLGTSCPVIDTHQFTSWHAISLCSNLILTSNLPIFCKWPRDCLCWLVRMGKMRNLWFKYTVSKQKDFFLILLD